MRKRQVAVITFVALVCLLFFPSASVFSQNPQNQSPVDIRRVDGTSENTPVYSVKGENTSGRGGNWFRAYTLYDTAGEWVDEVTFTFYVRVKGKNRDVPPFTLFKGETTYINIKKGKEHVADMFIHPNIIERYGNVDAIAVEVRSGGRVVARDGKPRPSDAWWEKFTPITDVLMNRSQTPFAFINLDTQEIIKPTKN